MRRFPLRSSLRIFFFALFCHQGLAQDPTALLSAIKIGNFELATQMTRPLEKCDEEVVKFVIDNHSNSSGQEFALENGPAVKFLAFCIKEKGLGPNFQGRDGFSAAMFAAAVGERETAEIFFGHKEFNPNLQTDDGWTAAIFAANFGRKEILPFILRHEKFDPNVQNDQKATAAMYAVASGHPDSAQLIIQHEKFEPNLQNRDGWTVALAAAFFSSPENIPQLRPLFGTLLKKGALFEGLKDNFSGQNVLEILEGRGGGFAELGKDLRNYPRVDADLETACTEEQFKKHLFKFPSNPLPQCIICLDQKDFLLRAHPENPECEGVCGECHGDFVTSCLESAGVEEDFMCPSRQCRKPVGLSYLMAAHFANRFLSPNESPLMTIENEKLKKALGLHYRKTTFKLPGYIPCHREECPGYGNKKNEGWFQCLLCKKERYLEDEGSDPGIRVLREEGIKKGTHCICPKCKTFIEKNGGCQHMTCGSCRHEFMVPSGQDFKKHCPFCQKKVTIPNVYDGAGVREATCPHSDCGKEFQWDEAGTYQD